MSYHNTQSNYTLSNFMPLILIFSTIVLFVLIKQVITQVYDVHSWMSDFMGAFFLVFGAFKLMNIANFVQAYKEYDLLAQRSTVYAYVYPFIECLLGVAYLAHMHSKALYIFTALLMMVSAAGVIKKLWAREQIVSWACV
jgi:hypothetical protein